MPPHRRPSTHGRSAASRLPRQFGFQQPQPLELGERVLHARDRESESTRGIGEQGDRRVGMAQPGDVLQQPPVGGVDGEADPVRRQETVQLVGIVRRIDHGAANPDATGPVQAVPEPAEPQRVGAVAQAEDEGQSRAGRASGGLVRCAGQQLGHGRWLHGADRAEGGDPQSQVPDREKRGRRVQD